MSQEIIFTTLPHNRIEIDGKKFLQASVFTSIKLATPSDTTLSNFENILKWSEIVKTSNFKFKFGNGKEVEAQLKREQIDTDLFQSIFHKNIKVDDFKEEDFSTKKFYSVPIFHVQNFVLGNYKLAAIKNPKTLISADQFIDATKYAAISNLTLNKPKIDAVEKAKESQSNIKPFVAKDLMKKEIGASKTLLNDLKKDKFIRFNAKMNPKKDFTQLRQFHRVENQFSKRPTFKIKKPSFEFHDIMSVLNAYPQIMRKLGLILDFLIEYDTSIPNSGTIKLVPDALDLDETKAIVSISNTAYNLTSKGFYVSDKPNTIFKQGFVKINTEEFSVIQVDTDGAALKTVNMVETKTLQVAKFYEARAKVGIKKAKKAKKKNRFTKLEKVQASQKTDIVTPPEDEGLPYMRTAGIAIVKNGMAEYLFNSTKLNATLKQDFKLATVKNISVKKKFEITATPIMTQLRIKEPEVVLYSNEIIQGYRMDIAYKDQPNKWYSLHQKKDSYTWYDEANKAHPIDGILEDEGFIQLGVAQNPDDENEVFVSETLARWEGWSLSVHKPGYAINEAKDYKLQSGETVKKDFVHKNKTDENKKYIFDTDLEFRINASSKMLKGTLPKLRFGKDYHIRVRTVDLAGNSVVLDSQSESPELTKRKNIRYLRYEPLSSPITLVGNELKDGEFLERMVIRSNYDQTSTEYEDSHEVNGQFFDEFSQRYLLPPKNSQLIAETHAKFEKAFAANATATQTIYKIITDHEGLYQQKEKNKERVYQPAEVEIIYLPDPMAAGVSLFVAEGYKGTHTQDFNAKMFSFFSNTAVNSNNTNAAIPVDWYNAGAIRIRLEEGTPTTKWDANKRIFTIFLPKGHRTRIKISTFWREQDFNELSAIWQLIKNDSPTNKGELEKLAKAGQHWMLSPAREMELVHAVQQPVDKPIIEAILPDKDYDETSVDVHTRFDIHGESTEKVTLYSRWTDPLDDGISVSIKEKEHTDIVANIPIHYHDDKITKGTIPETNQVKSPNKIQLELKPAFRIKKRTKSQFKTNPQPGASKINALYQPQLALLNKFETGKKTKDMSVVNRLKLDILEPKLSLIHDVNFRINPLIQHFEDTKHRWVSYKLSASSRYREYFDKILAADKDINTVRESDWIEKVNILSSSRPKPPEIDYIIPTFEWKKSKSDSQITHQRLGGGLRVFIKRPWYSTGVDEKLAVIIPTTSSNYSSDFTHWGIDPILFSTKPTNPSPSATDFKYKPVIDKNISYPDTNIKATAVAYPVHFDEERQLWYCDIGIATKEMYFPFIKLALARYQEHSVRKNNTDVCLSSVVTAKMMQVIPDRKAKITFIGNKKNHIKVAVEGPVYNDMKTFGNYSTLRISFFDQENSQPVSVIIDPNKRQSILDNASVDIAISARKNVANNRLRIVKEIELPAKFNTTAYRVLIEEIEHGPKKMGIEKPGYEDRITQSSETDRLIYADVFVVNE